MFRRVRRAAKLLWIFGFLMFLVALLTFHNQRAYTRGIEASSLTSLRREDASGHSNGTAAGEGGTMRMGKEEDEVVDMYLEDNQEVGEEEQEYDNEDEDYIEEEDEDIDEDEMIPDDDEVERIVADYEDDDEEDMDDGEGGGTHEHNHSRTPIVKNAFWYESVAKRFEERRRRLQEVCQKYNDPVYSPTSTKNKHMYYSQKYQLMVCLAAKVGSSTWKSHLLHMRDIVPHTYNIHAKHFESKIKAKLLLGSSGVTKALQTSTNVMTVRHPLERLVSAYRDKFLDGKAVMKAQSDGHMRYFWKPALRALKKPRNPDGTMSLTFEEFLRYVILDQRHSAGDPHWMRFYRTCSCCAFHYHFVMRLETYCEDLAYIMHSLNITEVDPLHKRHSLNKDNGNKDSKDNPTKRPSNPSSFTEEPIINIKNSTLQYYMGVPPITLAGILKMYKIDLEMFKYEVPSVLQRIVDSYESGGEG